MVASGHLSATFSTLAETSGYATGLQLNFPEQFLLRYTKNAYTERGFSKRYLHNSQLIKANVVSEAVHNAFRTIWVV